MGAMRVDVAAEVMLVGDGSDGSEGGGDGGGDGAPHRTCSFTSLKRSYVQNDPRSLMSSIEGAVEIALSNRVSAGRPSPEGPEG